jgi:hypothetical protein
VKKETEEGERGNCQKKRTRYIYQVQVAYKRDEELVDPGDNVLLFFVVCSLAHSSVGCETA